MLLLKVLTCILFCYLAFSIVYLLVVAVAGRFGKTPGFPKSDLHKRILVLIPSYREDAIIPDTARKAAAHNYPRDKFEVMVVADKLQATTVEILRKIPVQVLEVDLNMKSRSVHAALNHLREDQFDIVVLLDADNIMQEDCLAKINDAFQQGCQALQCHRTAKNQHTDVAVLDAISEEININLFRRGPAVLGISPAPIGSGMAFSFALIRQIFNVEHILSNPGEDREIDMQLMKQRIFMHYLDDAYVLDEKVANKGVFEKQRVRWLEAQVNHVRRFFDADMRTAPRSISYYCKFVQNLFLPRLLLIMLLALLFLVLLLQWIMGYDILFPTPGWWLAVMVAYALVLALSVPARYYSWQSIKAIGQLPGLMLAMLRALLKIKKERKEFLHTPKTYNDSDPSSA